MQPSLSISALNRSHWHNCSSKGDSEADLLLEFNQAVDEDTTPISAVHWLLYEPGGGMRSILLQQISYRPFPCCLEVAGRYLQGMQLLSTALLFEPAKLI
jgi:hypothetical protein